MASCALVSRELGQHRTQHEGFPSRAIASGRSLIEGTEGMEGSGGGADRRRPTGGCGRCPQRRGGRWSRPRGFVVSLRPELRPRAQPNGRGLRAWGRGRARKDRGQAVTDPQLRRGLAAAGGTWAGCHRPPASQGACIRITHHVSRFTFHVSHPTRCEPSRRGHCVGNAHVVQ
jgi:hypothetical protein